MSDQLTVSKPGWQLANTLVEIYWKRGPQGFYADRVRIAGCVFWYITGKKASLGKKKLRNS